MNLLSKIALSGKFGKSIYVISGVLTVAMCSLVLMEPVAAAACFFIKLISIAIIFYLYTSLSDKAEMYFYLNLGISRNEYYIIPFAVEFFNFIILIIITGKIGYALQ